MPLNESVGPTFSQLVSATRDVNGGLTSTLSGSGTYRAGGHSAEVGDGGELELDYVCNTMGAGSEGYDAHCGLGLSAVDDWSYTFADFSWVWSRAGGSVSAQVWDKAGGGLIAGTSQAAALPVACRITVSPAGVVRWYFGNGEDALIHTSTRPAAAVLEVMRGLSVHVGFRTNQQVFTPITFAGEDLITRSPANADFPGAVARIIVAPATVSAARPRPAGGKVWPRLV